MRSSSAALAAVLALSLVPHAARAAPDLSGYWWIKDRSQAIQGVSNPPLTAAAAAQYAVNKKAAAEGKTVPPGDNRCLLDGASRMMLARYPFEILQRPEQVTFLLERMHQIRLVYIDQPDPADIDPAYDGFSTGHWDGDVLVVKTDHFNDKTALDATGLPHSDRLTLTERFRLADHGETLLDQVTVDDPIDYTQPWSFTIAFAKQRGVRLMEDVCTYAPPQRDTLKSAGAAPAPRDRDGQ